MKNDVLGKELLARGLVYQNGGGTVEEILAEPRTFYLGIDPSADSIHMGNLVPIILAKHLVDAGHTPVLLVGGGTGLIGDPKESGERPLLDETIVAKNAAAIKAQLSSIIEKTNLQVVNNAEWLQQVGLLVFLRDIGKYFSVNQLVKRDLIKKRLETDEDSISYTEFTYSLLQAYDYLELNQKYGVNLQIGGSDQWANIISGVDLVRRKEAKSVYALTTPIVIDRVTGKKFGKSEGNAVWLDAAKTSSFQFYQFWINVSDANVEEYLKIFTFLSLQAIEDLLAAHTAAPEKRQAQQTLAKEVTTFVHGAEAAASAERASLLLYGGDETVILTAADIQLITAELPQKTVTTSALEEGVSVVNMLVETELASSKKEAQRLIEGGGVAVNDKTVDISYTITTADAVSGLVRLRKGKKMAVLIVE